MARRGQNKNLTGPAAPAVALGPVDRDVDNMLCKSQPGYFSGEGDDVGKQLEEWLEKMEDYFDLAHSSEANKAMMGRFKLEKSTKLWWARPMQGECPSTCQCDLGLHQYPAVHKLPNPNVPH